MNRMNKKGSKYIKQKLTDNWTTGQIGNQTIVVRGLTTLFSEIYSKKKQKISKDIEVLNNTIKHLDTYIYIIDYAKSSDNIFFQVLIVHSPRETIYYWFIKQSL